MSIVVSPNILYAKMESGLDLLSLDISSTNDVIKYLIEYSYEIYDHKVELTPKQELRQTLNLSIIGSEILKST